MIVCREGRVALGHEILKEVLNRDSKHPGEVEQTAGHDAVAATLILLDLLEGDAEGLRQGVLAEAQGQAA